MSEQKYRVYFDRQARRPFEEPGYADSVALRRTIRASIEEGLPAGARVFTSGPRGVTPMDLELSDLILRGDDAAAEFVASVPNVDRVEPIAGAILG